MVGTHLYLQETEEAARVTLLKSCAQGPQPPNLLPWLWKAVKPTRLGMVGGAGVLRALQGTGAEGGGLGASPVFLWAEDHQHVVM